MQVKISVYEKIANDRSKNADGIMNIRLKEDTFKILFYFF